jgi:hypothetical protein
MKKKKKKKENQKYKKKRKKIQSGVAFDFVTTKKTTLLWKICKTKQKELAS